LHHPAKGEPLAGQAARGHGSLLAHVDISIEMHHPGGDPATRKRRLLALSRHAETPRHLFLELNPQGTDYLRLPDDYDDDFQSHWQVLRLLLEDADHKLTRQEILAAWPADFPRPPSITLWRWLKRALERGLLSGEGTGSKSNPFRYWLSYIETEWRQRDPDRHELNEMIAAANRPHFNERESQRQPHRRQASSDSADAAQQD